MFCVLVMFGFQFRGRFVGSASYGPQSAFHRLANCQDGFCNLHMPLMQYFHYINDHHDLEISLIIAHKLQSV